MNKAIILKITAVLLIVLTVIITSAAIASARQGAVGQRSPQIITKPLSPTPGGPIHKPLPPVTGEPYNQPVQPVLPGGQLGQPVQSYQQGGQVQHPGDPIKPYTAGQKQFPGDPIRPYSGESIPVGDNAGIAGYQNTPALTTKGVFKQTPEKVEAGSENVRAIGQNPPAPVTGGQFTQPVQPVQPTQQPYDASLLRGSSGDRKGGRYLGQP